VGLGRGAVRVGLGPHVLGLVRGGGHHVADPPGRLQELAARGGVGEQPARFRELGAGAEVARLQALALAVRGRELVLGPLDVGVDLEPVVAGQGTAEHRRGREDGRQVAGDVRARPVERLPLRHRLERAPGAGSPVVGLQLDAHSTCLSTRLPDTRSERYGARNGPGPESRGRLTRRGRRSPG
jgi:hypothetical protein